MSASAGWRRAAVFVALALVSVHGRAHAADLMELYLKAVEFDPEVRQARIERLTAQEGFRESRGALMPGLTASAEASRVNQNIVESTSLLFTPGKSRYYNTGYSISLSQPLYRMDVMARMPQARAEIQQAEASYSAAEQDLIFRMAQAYFNFLAARDNLELASAERQAIDEQLQEAEQRFEAGLVTITDVEDLRGRFAVSQAREIEAGFQLEDAGQVIALITGFQPEELKRLNESFPLVRPDRENADAWVAAALFQNPRLLALQAGVDVAEQEIRRQRGSYLPSFDFVASFSHADSGGTVFGGGNKIDNGEVGLRLSVPLFDGGRTSARVQAATLRRGTAEQELEKERRRVTREVRASYQGVLSGIHLVEALDKSVFAHEAALSVKQEGWRSGVNTGLIVLDARRELFEARRDLAQSRYLYILSGLRLKQSTGILGVQDLRQINAYLE